MFSNKKKNTGHSYEAGKHPSLASRLLGRRGDPSTTGKAQYSQSFASSSLQNSGTGLSPNLQDPYQIRPHSSQTQNTSFPNHGVTSHPAADRIRTRRDRTYIGTECCICAEPLEHMLRGERMMHFSCSHVSHEACFDEILSGSDTLLCPSCDAPLQLDANRPGNADFNNIRLATNRNHQQISTDTWSTSNSSVTTPSTWDTPSFPKDHQSNDTALSGPGGISSADSFDPASLHDSRRLPQQLPSQPQTQFAQPVTHARNISDGTALAPPSYSTNEDPYRKADAELSTNETKSVTYSHRPIILRNPIPPPIISVRSEFPTISRSRQQQSLTCLVTIEVPANSWQPDVGDIEGTVKSKLSDSSTTSSSSIASPTQSASQPLNHSSSQSTITHPPQPSTLSGPASLNPSRLSPPESPEVLNQVAENLQKSVEYWHGLDFNRFGTLRLNGSLSVGRNKVSWEEFECYLFSEMLICVKERQTSKNTTQPLPRPDGTTQSNTSSAGLSSASKKQSKQYVLRGSILIKKHLKEVTESPDENTLTISLSVAELPQFHLRFASRNQLKLWHQALLDLNAEDAITPSGPSFVPSSANQSQQQDYEGSETDESYEYARPSSANKSHSPSYRSNSSWGHKSSATEHSDYGRNQEPPLPSLHVPIDFVVVFPVSSSMQGVKINIVRDALRFLVSHLGDRDRMGLVTFGSGGGGVPIVGMTTRNWTGWSNVLSNIKPLGQKTHRADVVEGANVAMDLLIHRKYSNPIASIMLISDASGSEQDTVDFVISRAEASKITIHSFGLGMTHKPDTMIELSSRTKATYTYVKDWMMLRECLGGCLGSLQTLSHQNIKLKLKLPEGSPTKFHKISGGLQITKRASGRDAEISLGDFRFGDKRDVLVQLVILPDSSAQDQVPQDSWDSIVSGLEALGGSSQEGDDVMSNAIDEVPIIQADIVWGDILRDGSITPLPRPSLLAITMIPASSNAARKASVVPPIPPHPSIVQRRMELLTSDMLTRALTLVSRGQHDRAHTLLNETRSILKGLAKGGLPPLPSTQTTRSISASGNSPAISTPIEANDSLSPTNSERKNSANAFGRPTNGPPNVNLGRSLSNDALSSVAASGVDSNIISALDMELESALEWINHPAIFARDNRKAALQAIGVISSQRAFTFRSSIESIWAGRITGVNRLINRSKEWRDESGREGGIVEE